MYGIIHRRRASAGASPSDRGDLLSMLMSARDEDGSRMTDRQLRDEIMTFLLAGHETTALSLSWTWYLLSENPEVEEKLQAELRAVSARPYTGAARLAESGLRRPSSQRIHAPLPSGMEHGPGCCPRLRDRRLSSCRPGANVVMSQWIMHRDPRFFPDPVKFDPDRWANEKTQSLPRFAYFPFGGGPRQCIGASFAMMEATLLLAAIAQRFQLRLVPGHPVVPFPSITLRPKYGIRMSLHQPG